MKNHLDRNIFSDSDIEDYIDYICSVGIKTKIFYLWRPYLRDPLDDHVLELAINAGAETILTINKKDFLEAESLGMKIQTPKEFLEEISINQFIVSAVAEKISALETQNYLEERAERGSRNKFMAVLSKVPDTEPADYNR